MKQFLVILLCVILAVSLCAIFIGEPVDGNQLSYTITETGQDLILSVHATDSAMALRDWKYQTEGNVMSITVRKVPVSPFAAQGSNHISLSTNGLQEIRLGGKLIWVSK